MIYIYKSMFVYLIYLWWCFIFYIIFYILIFFSYVIFDCNICHLHFRIIIYYDFPTIYSFYSNLNWVLKYRCIFYGSYIYQVDEVTPWYSAIVITLMAQVLLLVACQQVCIAWLCMRSTSLVKHVHEHVKQYARIRF